MPQEFTIASRWSRLGAVILDSIFLLLFNGMITYVVTHFIPIPAGKLVQVKTIVGAGLSLFSILIYYPIFTIYGGATPGKMILHIKVMAKSNEPLAPVQVILREVIYKSISFIVLGPLWCFFNEKNRTFWDFACGSIVVDNDTI